MKNRLSVIMFILACSVLVSFGGHGIAVSINQTEGAENKDAKEHRDTLSIIPWPAELTREEGTFLLNDKTRIYAETGNKAAIKTAEDFRQKLAAASGLSLKVRQTKASRFPDKNMILFTSVGAEQGLGKEGYSLKAGTNGILVKASSAAGLFYGMQTLMQLLPAGIESRDVIYGSKWAVPAVNIRDYPRYEWRGLHLDVCRHMSSVDFIKEYVDNMALHKLNTFHWHLTDDQGWRIQIKKYPRLTEVGAWRDETLVGFLGSGKYDGVRYGGFYTQEEVKEIVAYAKERFITVVPEIELPGHATAAIAAYPWLGVTGNPVKVQTTWGIFPDIFNVKDSTFQFLEDVLTEVMALFPGKYIHIGGDEAIKDQWEASEQVQAKIRQLGLKNEHELQSWFITRVEKFLNSHGKLIIGWDEILEGGLAPNAAVMSWRGEKGGIAAAKSGHQVVMTPSQYLYLNIYQGDRRFEPMVHNGLITLEKLYTYDPTPRELSELERKFIVGVQGNVWTEYLPDQEIIEYMVFPRIAALSEIAWSQERTKDWEAFKRRIPRQLERYRYRNINYATSIYDITYTSSYNPATGNFQVTLSNQFGLPGMHYTVDGSGPSTNAKSYAGPLTLKKGVLIKAGLYERGILKGKVTEIRLERPAAN